MRIITRSLPSFVALTLMVGWGARAFAQQPRVRLLVRQTATQSLTLIKPTNPDFEGLLDTYFPRLSQEDGYEQAIKPFLVIVRNDNSFTAVAYAITWTVRYADGSFKPLRALFVNRPLMHPGAMTYLEPGGVRLIAPMFNVTPERYGLFESFYPASSFPPSQGLVSVDENADGVVYSDGSFIGADTTKVLQRYAMAQFAARDEVLAALSLINSSTAPPFATAEQLEKMFSSEDQWEQEAYKHTLLALYVRARGNTAMDLRRILLARGTAGLEKLLQNFVNRSGGNTNPSMFARVYQKLSDNDPRVFGVTPLSPKGP